MSSLRRRPTEYAAEIPVAFVTDAAQAERLRRALALLDPDLVEAFREHGVSYALCSSTHTPSRTLAAWYPHEHDRWAQRHFGRTYDEAWGWYDEPERVVVATNEEAVATVVHELGHALDELLGSVSARFYRPGHGVTAYAETDAREFWAEAFEQWHLPGGDRDAVARAHPDFPRLFERAPALLRGRGRHAL